MSKSFRNVVTLQQKRSRQNEQALARQQNAQILENETQPEKALRDRDLQILMDPAHRRPQRTQKIARRGIERNRRPVDLHPRHHLCVLGRFPDALQAIRDSLAEVRRLCPTEFYDPA